MTSQPDNDREQAWRRFWAAVDRIRERNADKDPDEVCRDVTEVVEEVRQERYERELAAVKRRRSSASRAAGEEMGEVCRPLLGQGKL